MDKLEKIKMDKSKLGEQILKFNNPSISVTITIKPDQGKSGKEGSRKNKGKRGMGQAPPPPPSFPKDSTVEVEGPSGFEGKLLRDEKWLNCPYYNHPFLNIKAMTHLSTCRKMYLAEKEMINKPVEIMVCKYDSTHHVHVSEIKNHELTCCSKFGLFSFSYLEGYLERSRYSKQNKSGPKKNKGAEEIAKVGGRGGRAQDIGDGGCAQDIGDGGCAQDIGDGGRAQDIGDGGRAQDIGDGGRAQDIGGGGERRAGATGSGERHTEATGGGERHADATGGGERCAEATRGGERRTEVIGGGERRAEATGGAGGSDLSIVGGGGSDQAIGEWGQGVCRKGCGRGRGKPIGEWGEVEGVARKGAGRGRGVAIGRWGE